MDAFTGDGIPTHLLTREAIEIYLSRLAERGLYSSTSPTGITNSVR